MSELKQIPVIDLFAGPGGLAEGFSSVENNGNRVFDIRLSVEMDESAHKTLELRSFYRQFQIDKAPDDYYNILREADLTKREILKKKVYKKFKKESDKAKSEAWHAELGGENFSEELVMDRISKSLNGEKNWVLIGGPPCQAYSLAGRSRVGGIDEEDHRVYLYKEYLRVIANHHPSVFIMENVKGLLSAEVDGQKVFHWMLKDLSKPGEVFNIPDSPEYNIYSLVKSDVEKDSDYLIKSENYGVPQKRHRVILLGLKKEIDMANRERTLSPADKITLGSVIDGLPAIRSGLNRRFLNSEIIEGKKKRYYSAVKDSVTEWEKLMKSFSDDIIKWNGFSNKDLPKVIKAPVLGTGSEYINKPSPIDKSHSLYRWYKDERLTGVPNHQSRTHLVEDLKRYLFASVYTTKYKNFPRMSDYEKHGKELLPDHESALSGKFTDRFRVQLEGAPATTVTSHISRDGHYFIHYDPEQCRSLTVREAARIQTFPDNYLFCGSRTQQFHQVGNAVPPFLAKQISEIVYDIFNETYK